MSLAVRGIRQGDETRSRTISITAVPISILRYVKDSAVVRYPDLMQSPMQMGSISGINSTWCRLCDARKGPLTWRSKMTNSGGPRISRGIGTMTAVGFTDSLYV